MIPYGLASLLFLVTQMGVITPPVGINVYVVAGIAKDIRLETIFKGVLPFLIALIIGTIFLIAVPQITLWLPRLMY